MQVAFLVLTTVFPSVFVSTYPLSDEETSQLDAVIPPEADVTDILEEQANEDIYDLDTSPAVFHPLFLYRRNISQDNSNRRKFQTAVRRRPVPRYPFYYYRYYYF